MVQGTAGANLSLISTMAGVIHSLLSYVKPIPSKVEWLFPQNSTLPICSSINSSRRQTGPLGSLEPCGSCSKDLSFRSSLLSAGRCTLWTGSAGTELLNVVKLAFYVGHHCDLYFFCVWSLGDLSCCDDHEAVKNTGNSVFCNGSKSVKAWTDAGLLQGFQIVLFSPLVGWANQNFKLERVVRKIRKSTPAVLPARHSIHLSSICVFYLCRVACRVKWAFRLVSLLPHFMNSIILVLFRYSVFGPIKRKHESCRR